MKKMIIAAVMVTVLGLTVVLAGCSAQQNTPAATQAPAPAATEAVAATAAPATEAPAPAATAAPAQQDNNSGNIDLEKAKSIAVEDAGLSVSNVNFTKANLDTDDGVQKYEIEFTCNGNEYDYDINAQTGAIMEKSQEIVEPYDD